MQMEYQLEVEQDAIWLLASEAPFQSAPPFWVREAGRFTAKPSFFTSRTARKGYILLYTDSGEGELTYNGKRYSLPTGSIAFLDCRYPHEYRSVHHTHSWSFYWAQMDVANCEFYHNAMFKNGFSILHCHEGDSFNREFEDILQRMQSPQTGSYSQISHAVSSILTDLLELHADQQRRNTLHQDAIETTVRYIRENYREAIDVDFLAEKASLSKYYYIKLFKDIMHATPYEYLLSVRINEAKKLLQATELKSAEIGSLVGFADECNFSRTFKRLAGITPIQYRKSV